MRIQTLALHLEICYSLPFSYGLPIASLPSSFHPHLSGTLVLSNNQSTSCSGHFMNRRNHIPHDLLWLASFTRDDLCGLWTWWDLELPKRHTSVDVCEGFLEMVLTKWNNPPCLWAPSFRGQKPHTKWKRLSKWNLTTSSLCFLCADATWPVPHVCSMPRLSWRTVLSSHKPKHALPSSSWFVGCLVTVVKTLLK